MLSHLQNIMKAQWHAISYKECLNEHVRYNTKMIKWLTLYG